MEETIDYSAVITQLQVENELLRSHMKMVVAAREAVYRVPGALEDLWHKVAANKYRLLVGLMIVYWAVSIALLLYDRFVR